MAMKYGWRVAAFCVALMAGAVAHAQTPEGDTAPTTTPLSVTLFIDAATTGGASPAYEEFRRTSRELVTNAFSPTTPTQMMFYAAAIAQDSEFIEWLKDHGGDIDVIQPPLKHTAMHLAVLDHQTSAARVLLECGASTEVTDHASGTSPLLDAVTLDRTDLVELLLKHGADPDYLQPEIGLAPLHHAAMEGHEAILRLLLEAGADPNIADPRGVRPLHLAAIGAHVETMKLLLEVGADPNLATTIGTLPLAVAQRGSGTEVDEARRRAAVDLLIAHGARARLDEEAKD